MGLESKEVWQGVCGNAQKYYENLGYIIPKFENINGKHQVQRGTKILVKVEDLPEGSHTLVDVKCDNCNKKLKPISWQRYNKQVKENNKFYCDKCITKLFRILKTNKTKLKNSKSFEQWCIENKRQDILDYWDYELNNYKPNEILYRTNKKFYFKCPKNIHQSELKSINSFVGGHEGSIECKKCNSFAQWGIDNLGEDFLEKYWDYEKNTVDPWEISKCINKPKVWIKCQEKYYHGSYDTILNNFVNNESRCPYCTIQMGKVHKFDSLGYLYPEVLAIWSDKNKKSPYEYAPKSSEEVWWKCPEGKHDDYFKEIHNANYNYFRCPECVHERNESFLQEKVRVYLNELDYIVLHEYECNLKCYNPKTGYLLRYDNEITKLNLIIEVHGWQHYSISGFDYIQAKRNNTTPEYELYKRKLYDRYKRIYAKSKGYEYLEIPYWTDDKDETWKKLIDNKISSINNYNIKEFIYEFTM